MRKEIATYVSLSKLPSMNAMVKEMNDALMAREQERANEKRRQNMSMNTDIVLPKKTDDVKSTLAHDHATLARELKQAQALNQVVFIDEISQFVRSIVFIRIDDDGVGYVREATFYADGRKEMSTTLGFAQHKGGKEWGTPNQITDSKRAMLVKYVFNALKARNMRYDLLKKEQTKPASQRQFVKGFDARIQEKHVSWFNAWSEQRAILFPKTTAAKTKQTIFEAENIEDMDLL